jgi:hypothetical protein
VRGVRRKTKGQRSVYPGRRNKAFHGIINLRDYVKHYGKRGLEEVIKILKAHILMAIDPGVILTAGAVFAAMDLECKLDCSIKDAFARLCGVFIKYKLKTSRYYEATTDSFTREQNADMKAYKDDIAELKEHHPRTTDHAELRAYSKNFLESSDPLRRHNQDPKVLKAKSRSKSKKERFWANFVNEILAHVDALRDRFPDKNRTPIILFGGGKFQAKGHRSPPTTYMMRYLARFFLVIVVDEEFTSQNCSKCTKKLEKMEENGTRHWFCKNSVCCSVNKKDGSKYDKFIVHKDKSAPLNFTTIFASLLLTGKRPTAFCHPAN